MVNNIKTNPNLSSPKLYSIFKKLPYHVKEYNKKKDEYRKGVL